MFPIARTLILSLLVLAVPHLSASAAEDKAPPVEKLIEQLGSSDFAVRQRAARLLEARGPAVLPALRKAETYRDLEVRRRVREIIRILETAAAIEPKRVTLSREPRTLSDILQEIEKQTAYHIGRDDKEDGRLYRIEMKEATFWEAVERIGRETGRRVDTGSGSQDEFRLNPGETRSPFVAHRGSFRLKLESISENRHLDFTLPGKGKEPGHHWHRLTLSLSLLAEPRFILLDAEEANIQTATYEESKPLEGPAPLKQAHHRQAFAGMLPKHFAKTADILLQRPSLKTTTIKLLRGTIPVRLVVGRKRIVFAEEILKAKGKKCRVREGQLEIEEVTRTKDKDLILRIKVPPASEISADQWHERFRLEDAEGHLYKPNSRGTTSMGAQIIAIMLSYPASRDPKVGPPIKFLVEDWTTLDYAIPFEFKDVPLP